jgi:predicted metalloprotease with PDZ domain
MHVAVFYAAVLLLAIVPATHADITVSVGSQQLHLRFDENFPEQQQEKMRDWLAVVGEAMTTVYGSLPRDDIYLTLVAHPSNREAVPWAHVERGQRSGVRFFVNSEKPLAEFIDDWTAYHEFSHLLIPYPGEPDLWFSEGLASYYQNVVRARSDKLSPQQAWQKLYRGFERGAADTRMSHLSLAELSPRMRETASFMRVYWSGAYYFLAVDLALRRRGQSLDRALAGLKECCLDDRGSWNAAALAERLDQIVGGNEFTREYTRIVRQNTMPDFEKLFQENGLVIHDGVVSDLDALPIANAIMRPQNALERNTAAR